MEDVRRSKESEGLLFKPENFDPSEKYPVIFYFYERDADNLYYYRSPAQCFYSEYLLIS